MKAKIASDMKGFPMSSTHHSTAQIPGRLPSAMPYRKLMAAIEQWITLPKVPPSYYDVVGILLSLLFFLNIPVWLKILLVVTILLTDWLDGATARRYGGTSYEGYLVDMVTDRVSEGLIFAAALGTLWGKIFFGAWILNLALCSYSMHSKKNIVLPLRFVYICVLILQAC